MIEPSLVRQMSQAELRAASLRACVARDIDTIRQLMAEDNRRYKQTVKARAQ